MTIGYTVRGRKYSTKAASRGIDSDPIHQPVASVAPTGVPPTVRGGHVPTGVSLTESSMVGRPADHPAGLAGGQPLASGSGAPHMVQNVPVQDQLALLSQNVDLREYLGKNYFSN